MADGMGEGVQKQSEKESIATGASARCGRSFFRRRRHCLTVHTRPVRRYNLPPGDFPNIHKVRSAISLDAETER